MANYHVGCGIFGEIYAGLLNKEGTQWSKKTEVTDEAICSVMEHMVCKILGGF